MLTVNKIEVGDLLKDGYQIRFEDGTRLPRSFTPETDERAVLKFVNLCQPHEEELLALTLEMGRQVKINAENLRKGATSNKPHPCFSKMERLLNRLQKEANIIDS